MRQYLVKVHCCGSRWLIHVPAIERWTPVDDKKAITHTAKTMIADITGVDIDSFGVDLIEDRVVTSNEEYAVGATQLRRWDAATVMTGPNAAAALLSE
ncbi:hypothetical protein ACQPZ2_29555 [Nocardia pseudovaccinii]|uniref:hypothetical protein n=1 Tax=Nocardia pseudovaccinii TaxID=189540 RepID=UPI003D94E19C